jgi:UDP-N-acetylglucosamine 2-epimerase (non-hydrolysing)
VSFLSKSTAGVENIGLIFGTRPEIIKLSPVIRFLEKTKRHYFVLHTGQHYSYEMDQLFFEELELPEPKHKLSVHLTPSMGHGHHTGRMLAAVEEILQKERPSVVMVQGDTNSVLAGALVAAKLGGVKVAHVEAGLRSYDRQMPEEINRVIADHLSDYLFAPTPLSKKILLGEGIDAKKIHVTGNTIVDALYENLKIAQKNRRPFLYGLHEKEPFFLMTLHRQENVDLKPRLASILEGLGKVIDHFKRPLIFPAHPRTVKMLKQFGLAVPEGLRLVEPAGFLDFLRLEAAAELILTDSGGVQEEACILRVPCVTLRTTTERPETVAAGGNVIAGFAPEGIFKAAKRIHGIKKSWKNPFGDGHAAERIVRISTRKSSS